MTNFIFCPWPTFFFAPPPLKSEWMNAYVVTLRDYLKLKTNKLFKKKK